eukprot:m.469397 g.469397  ORF g.469397 m.469397 type:complete len:100 (-) comp57087_c0_seq43:569-868(-)
MAQLASKPDTLPSNPSAKSSFEQGSSFEQVPVDLWREREVTDWLNSLMMETHLSKFLDHGIKGPTVAKLTRDDLALIGITLPAQQTVILTSLAILQPTL